MKKFFSFLLVLSVLLYLFVFPASASEKHQEVVGSMHTSVDKIALEKAIAAFPEYEQKIRGENLNNINSFRSATTRTLIKAETRHLSEEEFVVYQEYSDGSVLYVYGVSAQAGNVKDEGNGVTSMNLIMTYSLTRETLYVSGVKFSQKSNSATITNAGSVSSITDAQAGLRTALKTEGTASNPAYVEYTANFTYWDSFTGLPLLKPLYLLLKVYPNSYSVSGSDNSITF